MKYDFRRIEEKWQSYWEENGLYTVSDSGKKRYYTLEMFPYPSGKLHMGHVRNYSIGDVVSRFKTMNGSTVLHPMGWDSFGLPAENAAIKNNTHPNEWTWNNIESMRSQLKKLGISYDWNREVASCHPDYYKWTQWLFLLFYKNNLAYKKRSQVNWCPSCATVLANEQVVSGECERCGSAVTKKELEQWFFKITDYAQRLLDDLEKLGGWPEKVKLMQKNWIGRSEGASVDFAIEGIGEEIRVFTTRPDTLFGATFMALAPEHPLCRQIASGTAYEKDFLKFLERIKRMSEMERTSTELEKEGVFLGSKLARIMVSVLLGALLSVGSPRSVPITRTLTLSSFSGGSGIWNSGSSATSSGCSGPSEFKKKKTAEATTITKANITTPAILKNFFIETTPFMIGPGKNSFWPLPYPSV